MNFLLFVGIDISKLTFDATIFHGDNVDNFVHKAFENTASGFALFMIWVRQFGEVKDTEILFCMENTGSYSIELSEFLVENGYFTWCETPLELKLSTGIKRRKTDKADSYAIAKYAYRYKDKAKMYSSGGQTVKSLKNLKALRDRVLKSKTLLEVANKELLESSLEVESFIRNTNEQIINHLSAEIVEIEKQIKLVIRSNARIKRQYDLITSITGVGIVIAVSVIVHTKGFTAFKTARQFACYCGVSPFEHSSGTTVHKRTKVSSIGNKKMKSLLTMGARSASAHDPEMKAYVERKRAEKKHELSIKNAVKNKLISRIFAVVKNDKPFEKREAKSAA